MAAHAVTVMFNQKPYIPTAAWISTNTPSASNAKTAQKQTKRPIAWWRGPFGSVTGGAAQQSAQVGALGYPDNGRIAGATELNLVVDPYVKVAFFYYPTMTLIGFAQADASGNVSFGYQGCTAGFYGLNPTNAVALDTSDLNNYAAIAFDQSRVYNLVGFDLLSAVT